MGARRSHTKSRNGCGQCKARRIKCDERPPQCSNCARRQIECQFSWRNPASSSSTAPPSVTSPAHMTATTPGIAPFPPPQQLNGSMVATTAMGWSLNVHDLELLHHYTTATYKTLPSGAAPDQHELWQIQVVQLGFQHEFLIRGILAVSALHLIHLQPNRRDVLAIRASNHQSIALQYFQEALIRVDPSNCVAIFAFSCVIVALAFAAPKSGDSGRFHIEVFDWFHMIRGCNSVLQSQWETVSKSFLAPLLKKGMLHETAAAHEIRDSERVTDLLRICSSENLAHDREAANAYALAIHELLNTYTQVSILMERNEDFVPVIFVWPVAIPQNYLPLLRDQKPEAMVILAHYSAILQRVDDQWYMAGWARNIVQKVEAALGEQWQGWLSWPKEVTRAGLPLPR